MVSRADMTGSTAIRLGPIEGSQRTVTVQHYPPRNKVRGRVTGGNSYLRLTDTGSNRYTQMYLTDENIDDLITMFTYLKSLRSGRADG